jgi:hypothetical protein
LVSPATRRAEDHLHPWAWPTPTTTNSLPLSPARKWSRLGTSAPGGGAGERDGYRLVGFRLMERGDGIEREFFTDNIHRALLEAILDVPHLVAILPSELAGNAKTLADVKPRLGGSLIAEVQERSPQVERVLVEHSDD